MFDADNCILLLGHALHRTEIWTIFVGTNFSII